MKPKFVLLKGIKNGNCFFSLNSDGDPTKSATGETWYKILGYAETVDEAQIKLYGRTFPLDGRPIQYGEALT